MLINAIIIFSVLLIHLSNFANYNEFLSNTNNFSIWKGVKIFWGIGLIIELLIGTCTD